MSNQTITIAASDEARPDASQTGATGRPAGKAYQSAYVAPDGRSIAPVSLDVWSAPA